MSDQLRLTGVVAADRHSFPLLRGENRVGTLRSNHIVLRQAGLSRRHAVLWVQSNGLWLEDLGSKNGTFVNGERIDETRLQVGDEVRFGQVRLVLEAPGAAAAPLAVVLSPPVAGSSALAARQRQTATAVAEQDSAEPGLALLEALLEAHAAHPTAPLSSFLAGLTRGFGAAGSAVVQWPGAAQPAVLGAWGDAAPLTADGLLDHVAAACRRGGGEAGRVALRIAGLPALQGAALLRADGETLALLVIGAPPLRPDDELLLRVLVHLVDRLSSPSRHAAASPLRSDVAELVFPAGYIRGRAPAMDALWQEIEPLLQGDLPVLISGETGVGKEAVAAVLHASSDRRAMPFVALNCAAIPEALLEAELFGVERGVATGVTKRRGRVRDAQGGVLFLDELGTLAPSLQAKLLRALEEKEIQPLGGATVVVDVRIVAATNSDLLAAAAAGHFRHDLYYRIAGYTLRVPPLRERKEDIPLLVEHFLRRFAAEVRKPVRGLTVRALDALAAYVWPGNVRELKSEVRRLVYLCPPSGVVDLPLLPGHLLTAVDEAPSPTAPSSLRLDVHTAALHRRLIDTALARTRGNRSQADQLLGISRNTLAAKIKQLGISSS